MRGVSARLDVAAANARLEQASPEERLSFAVEHFGERLLYTSSFGAGSGVLLYLWSRVASHLPVVFVDTGFLFDETHEYKDRLVSQLRIQVVTVRPAQAKADFLYEHGGDIYARDPDFCCARNKVDPLRPYLARARGWVSGLRRDQSGERADTPVLLATEDGPVKIHPIVTMTSAEVKAYLSEHEIPDHPLRARRFLSIGCAPCTRAVGQGEDERAGRWAGTAKTECGLHTAFRPADGASR